MKEKDKKISEITHVTRDDANSSIAPLITVSSISALTLVDDLNDLDRFEISTANDTTLPTAYLSKSVEWRTIFTKLQKLTLNCFDNEYKESRYNTIGCYFPATTLDYDTTVWSFLNQEELDISLDSLTEVKITPIVWNDVYALAINDLKLLKQLNDIDARLKAVEQTHIAFGPSLTYSMMLSTWVDDIGTPRSSDPEIDSLSTAFTKSSNGTDTSFTMAFFKTNNISTTYTCTKNGMLVVYGWLDSSNVSDLVYLPSSWCALEGNVNGNWEILQLAQVLPKRQLTYVSFTIPVVDGLVVRLRTGFIPGPASSRYSPQAGYTSSLSNGVPNAFFAGVYEMKGDLPDTSTEVAYIKNPIGTIITNVAKPLPGDENGLRLFPGDKTWALCNGAKIDAALYPRYVEISGSQVDENGMVSLPTIGENNSAPYSYIKIK